MPSRPTPLPRCERPETPDFCDASRCSGPAAPGDGAQTGPRKPDGVGAEMMLSVPSTLFTTPTPGLPRERLRKSRRGRGMRYQAALLDEHPGTSGPQRGGSADAQPKGVRPDPRCRRTDHARPTFSLHSSFRRGAAAAEEDVSSPTTAKFEGPPAARVSLVVPITQAAGSQRRVRLPSAFRGHAGRRRARRPGEPAPSAGMQQTFPPSPPATSPIRNGRVAITSVTGRIHSTVDAFQC